MLQGYDRGIILHIRALTSSMLLSTLLYLTSTAASPSTTHCLTSTST